MDTDCMLVPSDVCFQVDYLQTNQAGQTMISELSMSDHSMTISVFDHVDRDLTGPAPYLISHFDYLNKSNRPEADCVRTLIDGFFVRYPAGGRDHLCRRLRSVDDIGHLGAFFELTQHELLIRAGCRVVTVEPKVRGTDKAPDFLVETSAGGRFYLEATLATGRSQADTAAQKRLDQALKTIDAVPTRDFFLSLSSSGTPTAPITGRRLRNQLSQWLDSLSYDAVAAAWQAGKGAMPVFRYEEHGLCLRISPVPRQPSHGVASRAIGMRTLNPLWVQSQAPIRQAVANKATRYGDLDLPYVVAVNAMSDYADEVDAVDALFGSLAVVFQETESGYEDRPTRVPNGVWQGRCGAINTRVSAVLSTERLSAWSLGQCSARLIVNPWAQRPLPPISLNIDTLQVEGEYLRRQPGSTFQEIFNLPDGWPG